MKFGVAFPTAYFGADPDAIAAYAQHAEACGFESFYMSEHVAMYKGAELGGVVFDPTVPSRTHSRCSPSWPRGQSASSLERRFCSCHFTTR